MAGPGLRYLALARTLAAHVAVTFAIPNPPVARLSAEGFPVVAYRRNDWPTLEPLARASDAILLNTDLATDFPALADLPAALILDAYDPMLSEGLAMVAAHPLDQQIGWWRERMNNLRAQWRMGDFYLCASERQRDWCLGQLESAGRINPLTIAEDPALRGLVDVVASGLDPQPPEAARPVLRGVWPGIGARDRIVLWGGGLWPWLDPLTAIRAFARVAAVRDDVRLVFPGTRHPNPAVAGAPTHAEAARALAVELGLADRAVLFGDWVPYADWPAVLLESDLALSLHRETYETRLAFRSRTLGYIWASVPTLATAGDETAAVIARYGLGEAVPEADPDALAAAILRWLEVPRASLAGAFARAQADYAWPRVAAPLIRYCLAPRKAADRRAGLQLDATSAEPALRAENARLRETVSGYERGRFIRFMRWLRQR